MSLDEDCNPAFFNFNGRVTRDLSPPTNFTSKNAFISCLRANVIIADTIISGGEDSLITGAINIGVGLGIIPPKPGDVSGSDIVHKSLLFVSPLVGTDGATVITASAPSVVVGPTPAISTDDAVVCWDGTTGRLVKDSTTFCSELISGPAFAFSNNNAVVCWDGTDARRVRNSVLLCDNPSPGGLHLFGDFQVPATTSSLTFTTITVLAPIATAIFPGAPSVNILQRFGNIAFIRYANAAALAIMPGTTVNMALAPLLYRPTLVGQQLDFVTAFAAPTLNLTPTAAVAMAGGLSGTPAPGTVVFDLATSTMFALAAGTVVEISSMYFIV